MSWLDRFRDDVVLRQKYSLVATNREEREFSYMDKNIIERNLYDLEQIQANYPFRLNSFCFDIDNPEDFEALDKLPTFQTFNRTNHKSHVVYMLDKPFESHNQRLKLDIAKLFTQAKIFTHTDLDYKNITTKNPFNTEKFEVRVLGGSIQNLFENFHQVLDVEIPEREVNLFNFNYYSASPNTMTFKEVLIQWSKSNTHLYFKDRKRYEDRLYNELEAVNAIVLEQYKLNPLTDSSAEDIAINVLDFMDTASPIWRERFIKRQQFKQMRSAEVKRTLREQMIIQAFDLMRESGEKITVSKLAKNSGISRQALSRYYSPLIAELQASLKANKKSIIV